MSNSSTVVRIFVLCLLISFAPSALAWTSGREGPDYGPTEMQKDPTWHWDAFENPPNEHAWLLEEALARSGVPIAGTFWATGYADKDALASPSNGTLLSVFPTPLSSDKASRRFKRSYDIAGFSSLPDHAYSIGDWAAGGEMCPPGTTTRIPSAETRNCREFDSHLGMINSTHFSPQSELTYGHYHAIAMKRASDCKQFGDAAGNNRQATDAAKECEREAMLIESVGQHFLQDAWSLGHMWERWGYSSFELFPGHPGMLGYERAVVTGMVAGMIHGAESVALPVVGVNIPDAMNAGGDPRLRWRNPFVPNLGGRGVGDLHARDMLFDPFYNTQREQALNCSASGLRDVYAATAQLSGPMRLFQGIKLDPLSQACWKQRATNEAMERGFGFKCSAAASGASDAIKNACAAFETIGSNPEAWVRLVAIGRKGSSGVPLSDQAQNELRIALYLLTTHLILGRDLDPFGVQSAGLDVGPQQFAPLASMFMGSEKNRISASVSIPAVYSDPLTASDSSVPEPWKPQLGTDSPSAPWDPGSYISRVFNRSHTKEFCSAPETELTALQDRINSASAEDLPVACEICLEYTSRRVEVDGQSVCQRSGAVVSALEQIPGLSVRSAARRYCGCGHWDVAEDFDELNQDLDWRYGQIDLLAGGALPAAIEMRPFVLQGQYSGIDLLYDSERARNGTPNVSHNTTDQVVERVVGLPWENGQAQTGVKAPPKAVLFHPGPNITGLGAVRWTAPYVGNFRVRARFNGVDVNRDAADVFIIISRIPLPSTGVEVVVQNRLDAKNSPFAYDSAVKDAGAFRLNKGDQIFFAVGPGPRLDNFADTVMLEASIDRVDH